MEIRNLSLAKYFTAGIGFILLALGGSLWPFTWWDMYGSGDYTAPNRVDRLQLRVLDSAGQQHILHPMDLYTLDDDSSAQKPGHHLVRDAVSEPTPEQEIARAHLVRQLEFVLDAEVEQVEIWRYLWDVDFSHHPPIEIEQPIETQFVDRIVAQSN
ncbi:MAG: hypothetical protein AAF821_20670 [Cyanobacteria bacterium P01_D01_bin.156]